MIKINYTKPESNEKPDDVCIYNLKLSDKYKNLVAKTTLLDVFPKRLMKLSIPLNSCWLELESPISTPESCLHAIDCIYFFSE